LAAKGFSGISFHSTERPDCLLPSDGLRAAIPKGSGPLNSMGKWTQAGAGMRMEKIAA
jgi:hypothetical protein